MAVGDTTMAGVERTLNVADPQVLLHFPGDAAGFDYHHRLLLHKLGGGRWICLTPDLELEVQDLSARRHIVLGRAAPFPAHIAAACYIFDELSKNELERQRKLARTQGSILDDEAPIDVSAQAWVVSDPSSSRFGQVLPVELHDDIVNLGSHGVVEWEQQVEYVRELALDEIEKFKSDRQGTTGDLRVIGDHRDSQGHRHIGFKEAMTLFKQTDFQDWPFTGPRAVKEYLNSILAGPGDIPTYHLSWVRSSGVASGSAIVHEHRSLCEVLRLGISKDQLDITNLSSFENAVRRLITLEIAVSRNPNSPDFSGLEVVVESPISSQGAAHVSAMSSWVTERLKERANIAKQQRLYREEVGKKAPKKQDDDDSDGPRRWRKKKNNKGGKPSAGGDASTGGQQ